MVQPRGADASSPRLTRQSSFGTGALFHPSNRQYRANARSGNVPSGFRTTPEKSRHRDQALVVSARSLLCAAIKAARARCLTEPPGLLHARSMLRLLPR